eukprot:Amastigsp_a677716_90.p4 type:complete len:117 gc:universal Amastigsp_a677716_90:304-654(+)
MVKVRSAAPTPKQQNVRIGIADVTRSPHALSQLAQNSLDATFLCRGRTEETKEHAKASRKHNTSNPPHRKNPHASSVACPTHELVNIETFSNMQTEDTQRIAAKLRSQRAVAPWPP